MITEIILIKLQKARLYSIKSFHNLRLISLQAITDSIIKLTLVVIRVILGLCHFSRVLFTAATEN